MPNSIYIIAARRWLYRYLVIPSILGSFIFGSWFFIFQSRAQHRLQYVCQSLVPYLQIGSYRWAEDLAKSSLSSLNPEMDIRITNRREINEGTRTFVSQKCDVPGRSDEMFTIDLIRTQAFDTWLLQQLVGITLICVVLIFIMGRVSALVFEYFAEAVRRHFGISSSQRSSRFLDGVIEKLPGMREAGVMVEQLGDQLYNELNHTRELEIALTQRRLFSKLIHDIRSPLTALRMIYHKRSSSLSEAENNLIQQSFIRFDEINQSILSAEKAALSHSGRISQLIPLTDINPLLEITVSRLNLTFGANCRITLRSESIDTRPETLKISATELDRLISNLTINSKESGANHILVSTHLKETGDLEIVILDDGPGGLKDLSPKKTMNVNGYGLGLEIVREIISKSGTAEIEHSTALQGTSIRLRLVTVKEAIS